MHFSLSDFKRWRVNLITCLYEAGNTWTIVLTTCTSESIRGQIEKTCHRKFISSYFSGRQQPYNKFIRKNSLKSAQGFTFFFACIWYKESFKTNLVSMSCKLSSFVWCKWSHLPRGFDFTALIAIKLGVVYIHGIWKHPEELSTCRKGHSLTAYP